MRKLALVLAVALASGRASALGLGEIELRSALNEPFNAEIRLIVDQPAELDGAVVRLAPQESFQQAGIERPAALSDLAFNVVRRADGSSVIEVTSSQPVREPYLDFIVQVRWPTGRLLREYTVLLDPPVFSGDKLAPVAAPVLVPAVPAPKPQAAPAAQAPAPSAAAEGVAKAAAPTRPARSAPSAKSPAPAAESSAPGTYGPTQRSDTAWTIAAQVRPDNDVTIYQAMLALLAANPEAFYQGNINNLMAGYVLRVPGRELMTAISAQEAEREAARQYQQWRQARSGVPMAGEPSSAVKPAEAPAATAAMPGDESPRLKLVAPSQASAGASGAAGQAVEEMRGDLAIALESADAARRENEELRARLSALEGQINSMQRLMTLKDETLGDLQQRLGEEVSIPQVTPAEQAPAAESAPAEAEPAAPPPAAAPQPPAPQEAEVEPVFDLFDNPSLMAAAGGGVLLLLALAWLVARRRRAGADEDEGEITIEPRQEPVVSQAAPAEAVPAAQTMDEMAHADADEPAGGQMAEVAEEVAKGAAGDVQETADDLDVLHTAEGDIDPIVEADVYLAYRRYQQAEALIQGALAKNPHRHELKGKLLEIYYASRNTEAFQSLAETLYDELGQNADDPLWYRVAPMGAELLPNHPLFSGSAAAPKAAASAAATAAAGSALFAGEAADEGGEFDESMQAAGQGDDDLFGGAEQSLDLDLDAAAAINESGEPAEEKFDLDLNLGGDGLSDSVAEDASMSDEDLDAALDLPNIGAEDKAKQKTAAADDELLSEATGGNGKDESWDVDPAMSEFGGMDFNLDDSDFLAGTDVVGTKLDLARAYIDMGDQESARDILNEVLEEGNDQQKQEAQSLSQQLA